MLRNKPLFRNELSFDTSLQTDKEFVYRSVENGLRIFNVETLTSEEVLSNEVLVGEGALLRELAKEAGRRGGLKQPEDYIYWVNKTNKTEISSSALNSVTYSLFFPERVEALQVQPLSKPQIPPYRARCTKGETPFS